MLKSWLVISLICIYGVFAKKNSTKSSCICVPRHLCQDGDINTNGEGIIEVRSAFTELSTQCSSSEVCCQESEVISSEIKAKDPPKLLKLKCGQHNPNGVDRKPTSDASQAHFGEFPWMVAVFRKQKNETKHFYKCGGSLIHSQVVLTAAHCISGDDNSFKIRAGEWDNLSRDEIYSHQDKDVASVVVHPKFNSKNLHNDVGLLFLTSPVDFQPHINVICLPLQNTVPSNTRCFTSGWGEHTSNSSRIDQAILKKVSLPFVARKPCQHALRSTRLGRKFLLHKSFVCAGGEEGKDSCEGNGGSPLVCPIEGENDKYQQVGMVAWGIGCGSKNIPGVYVNVAKFKTWIEQQMEIKNFTLY